MKSGLRKIEKIVVANRGEIAVRIMQTAKKMGISVVALFTAGEERSLHVVMANEKILLEGDGLHDTYLNQQKIVEIALACQASAVHPGYGFLAENARFAEEVERAGLIFIGPTPAQIQLMGNKTEALSLARKLGIPVIPSFTGKVHELAALGHKLQYPVLVKAAAGGGGKGMKMVPNAAGLSMALQFAEQQAERYFADGTVYIEQFLPRTRHVEVQVFGDGKGNVVHFFERECSLQRRYQKIVEESPAETVKEPLKTKLYRAAVSVSREIGYRGAGTVEFLVDEQDNFYFLEMNTRLQVEHAVTELVTGQDLVEWQIAVAENGKLLKRQDEIVLNGHAIELRICAENPANGFLSSSGHLYQTQIPKQEGLRWDSFLQPPTTILPGYDSLLGKLIAHAETRNAAVKKTQNAVAQLFMPGIETNRLWLAQLLREPGFQQNETDTQFIERHLDQINDSVARAKTKIPFGWIAVAYLLHHLFRGGFQPKTIWEKIGHWRLSSSFELEIDGLPIQFQLKKWGQQFLFQDEECVAQIDDIAFRDGQIAFRWNGQLVEIQVEKGRDHSYLQVEGVCFRVRSRYVPEQVKLGRSPNDENIQLAMHVQSDFYGRVLSIHIDEGDLVQKGSHLLTIESMKTELAVCSPQKAIVKKIYVVQGEQVREQQVLVEFE